MKKKIMELLKQEFSSVYCDTCESKEDGKDCDECHRKAMNWGISEATAERLANEIISIKP